MLLTAGVTFLCFFLDISFNVDLTLLSIAIIFPLVFTIRGSFRRREKALEHLSEFRSTLKTVKYFLLSNETLTEESKEQVETILLDINDQTLSYLSKSDYSMKELDEMTHRIYEFVNDDDLTISKKIREKVFRFMKDLHESIENLHAIHSHRTPISLKAYCKLFIYVFPFIYAPTIIYNLGYNDANWIAYFIILLTEFILISLYNIQNQLEYPFDNVGMDDIKLDAFRIDR